MKSRSLLRHVQLPLRAAVAASAAVLIAPLLGLEHAVYALQGAVIATDLSPARTRRLGRERLAATLVGGACGAVLCAVLPSGPVAIGLGVLLALLLCAVLRVAEGAKVAGYLCGIIVFSHQGNPWAYASQRVAETLLGVAVAWAVSLVPLLVRFDESEGSGP